MKKLKKKYLAKARKENQNKGILIMSDEVKETKTVETKNTTWLNRIFSAVVGAAIAVGTTLGITNEQMAVEKAKVTSIKTQVVAALDALKAGDVTTATANLKAAAVTGKEAIADAKVIAENVKASDKASIIETAKEQITKVAVANQVKKVEAETKAYTEKATVQPKATEKKTK